MSYLGMVEMPVKKGMRDRHEVTYAKFIVSPCCIRECDNVRPFLQDGLERLVVVGARDCLSCTTILDGPSSKAP